MRSLFVCLFCYCFCLLLSSGGDLNFVCFHWARFQEKNDFGSSLMDLFLNPMPLKIPILCLQEEEMFRPNMFFLLLLPPIIFESGYSLHKVRLGHALVLLVWVTPCVSLPALATCQQSPGEARGQPLDAETHGPQDDGDFSLWPRRALLRGNGRN